MEKQKEDMQAVTFWMSARLKAKLERYCRAHGLSMAEALRCYVVGLPAEFDIEVQEESSEE